MISGAMTSGREFHRIVWPMAVGETIIWASFYYLFPAMLPEWERSMGWSKTELSGAMTLALLTSALLAPFAGRLIDRGFGRTVFTGGTVFGGLMLVAMSQTTELWQFYLVWVGLGIAMAAALYVACFSVLTHYMAARAKRAITLVTLVAGLAGTIAFPGVHALLDAMDWRSTVLIFAGFVFVISVPTVWISCTRAAAMGGPDVPRTSHKTRDVMVVTRHVTFWLIGIAVMAMSLGHGMIITHLLPILDDRGVHPDTAILAAAMIGPMQVSGRLAMMAAERHASVLVITVGSYIALFLAAVALLGAGGSPGLVVVFVILQGAGHGITSILQPVLTAELLGRRNFGVITGMLAIPYMGGFAAAPSISALMWTVGGYDIAIMLAGAIAVIGMTAALGAWRWRPALPIDAS